MREEYNSILSTPIEADIIGRFGRYRYISKTQYRPIYRPGRFIGRSLILSGQFLQWSLFAAVDAILGAIATSHTPKYNETAKIG